MEDVEIFKDLLIRKIEKTLEQQSYIPSQYLREIIIESVSQYFSIDSETVKKLGIDKPLYWSFGTPFHEAHCSCSGISDCSGIYWFDRKTAEEKWKIYKGDFEKRLVLAKAKS